jgi:hypothetical protein
LGAKVNSKQGEHGVAMMLDRRAYRLWDKGGREMTRLPGRALDLRFPISDTDGRTQWVSHAHGYAMQQNSPVRVKEVFFYGLSECFDAGQRGDFHILTMDANCELFDRGGQGEGRRSGVWPVW